MQNPTPEHLNTRTPDEAKIAALIAALALLLTCVPYLVGYFAAGKNHFLWLGANVDDASAYFSWIRQGETGSLRQINRFTTDPQPGLFANPFFLLLGLIARVLHLSPATVYHLSRLGFGAALLSLVWKFISFLLPLEEGNREKDAAPYTLHPTPYTLPRRARLLSFLFVCFASGLGWLPIAWSAFSARATCPPGPIDLWQPEAVTFLSLYLAPLFLASMCLQIAVLMFLLRAAQSGKNGLKYAVYAGLCGLLLSLVHSYDVLSIGAVWLVYLLIKTIKTRRRIASAASPIHHSSFIIYHSLLAGFITLPGVLLMASQLKSNKVFHARAAVETLSAYPQWLLLGYGLALALAIYAGIGYRASGVEETPAASEFAPASTEARIAPTPDNRHPMPFLTVWAVVNAAVSYLPGIAFQRKLLQGEHFPIAILAGIGAAHFLAKYLPQAGNSEQRTANRDVYPIPGAQRQIPARRFASAAGLLTLLLGMTNLQYLFNETERFQNHTTKIILARPELLPGEVEALQWIAANTPADAAVQPLPWEDLLDNPQTGGRSRVITDMTLSLSTPSIADRAVYCGHWGETPDYAVKLTQDIGLVALGKLPEDKRREILRKMNVQYLIFSQKDPADANADELFPQFRQRSPLPPYLRLVHSNADADVYLLSLP